MMRRVFCRWQVFVIGLGFLCGMVGVPGWAPAASAADPKAAPAAASDGLHDLSGSWTRVAPLGGRGDQPRAVALLREGEFAVADEAGVTWWRAGQRERAQMRDVRDVAFDASGTLWIGSASGLYAWSLPGRPVRRPLRGGEVANRIRRLVARRDSLLVATERGAFWSTSGKVFQPLEGVAANDDFSQAAFHRQPSGSGGGPGAMLEVDLWLFGRRGLIRIRGFETATGLRVLGVERSALPRTTREAGATDLSLSLDGRILRVAYPDAIAERSVAKPSTSTAASSRFSKESPGWVWSRPALPPGAAIRRFSLQAGASLLATDHGLLEAEQGNAPYRRVQSAAGNADCVDIRVVGEVAVALCDAGVFERGGTSTPAGFRAPGRTIERVGPVAPGAGRQTLDASGLTGATHALGALPDIPPLIEIRRRALRRSGISVARDEAMRRGLARRALLPELSFRVGADWDRDDARDADQAFVSGETRHLFDRSRDEGLALEAGLVLEWDFRGLAYPDDSVDLSRELRQVVSLRDDVADEINQLYFERQRIQTRLRHPDSLPASEAAAMYWRGLEIDSGLDAWTGGWIADWRQAQLKHERSHHPEKRKEERE